MTEHVHVVSLSGGRDSAAVGIWAAEEHDAGRIADLRYVHAAAQTELDLDERDCGDPVGTCTL